MLKRIGTSLETVDEEGARGLILPCAAGDAVWIEGALGVPCGGGVVGFVPLERLRYVCDYQAAGSRPSRPFACSLGGFGRLRGELDVWAGDAADGLLSASLNAGAAGALRILGVAVE